MTVSLQALGLERNTYDTEVGRDAPGTSTWGGGQACSYVCACCDGPETPCVSLG